MAEPLEIAPGKVAYVATLEDACRDLGLGGDGQADRLRMLARRCGILPNTLLSNLSAKGPPEPETLKKLRAGTGIPVATWYVRLGILDEADIARALHYDELPETLSEQQQRALDLVEGLPEDVAFEYLDFWERTPGLAAHRHGAPRSVRRRNRRSTQTR